MVAPVTGPFSKIVDFGPKFGNTRWTTSSGKYTRTWYRQKKPFSLPLTFSYVKNQLVSFKTNEAGLWQADWQTCPGDSIGSTDANIYNAAYSKFKGNLGTAAELSVAVAERKQAIGMVVKRSKQIFDFARALKRLDFSAAARLLNVKPLKKGRRVKRVKVEPALWKKDGTIVKAKRVVVYEHIPGSGLDTRRGAKQFANNYLEFHFGWSPLIADIGNAVDVLQGGCPPMDVKGSKTSHVDSKWTNSAWTYTRKRRQTVSLRAQVRITNPDLWLANQLGFTNPLGIAWELVPFSFVVDWFVNVSDFLGQSSDFLGVELINPHTTVFTQCDTTGLYYMYYTPTQQTVKSCFRSDTICKRSIGITGPSLRVRPPWTLSPRRGLAAISLLIQQLR